MYSQADKDKLKALGLDPDKLEAAAKADVETAIEVPEGQVIKDDDLVTRDANTKAEGKREGVREGKEAGKEIAGKALAKKFNLPATVDTKNIDQTIEAVSATMATGDEGLKEQVRLLQKDKETLTGEKENLMNKQTEMAFDNQLISFFPARDAALGDTERLLLIKNALQFETIDGKQVVKKNGEVMRNATTKDTLPVKDAIESFFIEKKWTGAASQGGRGAGNSNGGGGSASGIKKFSDAQAKWLTENPQGNVISPECSGYITAIAKDVTDFDWYN